jgi:very-short-patch-repair endonuclease
LGRGKYCSRECKDLHQKQKYKGEKNPMYGKKITEKTRNIRSDAMVKKWKDESYREKRRKGIENFVNEHGYYSGTDEKSKNRRKQTMLERYGVVHNWIGDYGERICDKTTVEKYGKSSVEMLSDYEIIYGKETDIEKIFKKILEDLSIQYDYKYRMYNKNDDSFWYREFDFLIKNTHILIEVGGDYWHGNEKLFETLNEFQIETQKKDKIKENFAISNGYRVLRFWGSEIKKIPEKIKIELTKVMNQNG